MRQVRSPLSGVPALAAAAWLAATGCSTEGPRREGPSEPLEEVVIKLDGPHGARFLGFYIAREEGLYAAEGLKVTVEEASEAAGRDTIPIRTAAGEFDFAVGSEGLVQGQRAGLPIVVLSSIYQYGLSVPRESLYTRREFLESRPDLVARFVKASLKGWQRAVDNPVEAVDEMLASFPELVERRDFWQLSFEASIPLIRPPGAAVGQLDCGSWREFLQLESGDAGEEFCDSSFWKEMTE